MNRVLIGLVALTALMRARRSRDAATRSRSNGRSRKGDSSGSTLAQAVDVRAGANDRIRVEMVRERRREGQI